MSSSAGVARAPLRVAHVIDSLRPGGAEHLVLTTVRHLDRGRFESLVIALAPPLDLKPDVERCGVPVRCLDVRGPLDWRRGIVQLAAVLRAYRPDIVHTHLLHASFFGRIATLFVRRPRVMTTLHHRDYTHWRSETVRFKARRLFERVAAPQMTDAYVAVSRVVRDDYVKHFSLRNVHVIYNYLDPDAFAAPGPEVVEAMRQSLGLTGKEFVLLNVGRLIWEKGQRQLLHAMVEIRRVVPEACLLLVGDGPDGPSLQAEARALGFDNVVKFLGNRRDIAALLALADVFVFPSTVEALGIALLEAMAARRAVVAAGVEGIPEVVDHGIDGLLTPAADPAALAESVLALYRDPDHRRRLGEAARTKVETRFAVDAGVPRLAALYEAVASGRA